MNTTLILAQVWGPLLIAAGLGFSFSRSFYRQVYRDIEKSPFTIIFFGMVALCAGIFQIQAHNIWDTFPHILISFLGWALLVKGVVCTVFPNSVDKSAERFAQTGMVSVVGWIITLAGVYLAWVGYFA